MSKRDKWEYVNAATADMARAILGVPSDTVVEQYCARNPDLPPCWAVKVPIETSTLPPPDLTADVAARAADAAVDIARAALRAAYATARAVDAITPAVALKKEDEELNEEEVLRRGYF